ncbi:uncharacterized protein PAC_09480 [Phialocephala subalpina]|uniref:Uncharacterized protein n=1 Tax=Phialocephala subalpina TaxID=576137 RepID=A0A1L7X3J3_9HELO|nr:uncharacterized protein PAC_09480 [Phialocephala subalpina]
MPLPIIKGFKATTAQDISGRDGSIQTIQLLPCIHNCVKLGNGWVHAFDCFHHICALPENQSLSPEEIRLKHYNPELLLSPTPDPRQRFQREKSPSPAVIKQENDESPNTRKEQQTSVPKAETKKSTMRGKVAEHGDEEAKEANAIRLQQLPAPPSVRKMHDGLLRVEPELAGLKHIFEREFNEMKGIKQDSATGKSLAILSKLNFANAKLEIIDKAARRTPNRLCWGAGCQLGPSRDHGPTWALDENLARQSESSPHLDFTRLDGLDLTARTPNIFPCRQRLGGWDIGSSCDACRDSRRLRFGNVDENGFKDMFRCRPNTCVMELRPLSAPLASRGTDLSNHGVDGGAVHGPHHEQAEAPHPDSDKPAMSFSAAATGTMRWLAIITGRETQ